MANNNTIHDNGRLKLVDPNNFQYQHVTNTSDGNYNMSVPLEDLCIVVELKTTTKSRTILSSNNDNSIVKVMNNTNGNNVVSLINFIGGKNDSTTGGNQVLTTSYTDVSDISATTDGIDEALGITSIDIEFNSSYAPMININFIDVRGAAIFQNGATSKYGVLFKLPYPIFQLKIKGYYGKPVIYCLHLTKCNSKFNSLTGNFEIAAQFVGYTYAMLSDMLLGYIRGAQETPAGKKIMSESYPNVLSINNFMTNVSKIDVNNPNAFNDKFTAINNLKLLIEQISSTIVNCITSLNNNPDNSVVTSRSSNIGIILKKDEPTKVINNTPVVVPYANTQSNVQTIPFTNINNITYSTNELILQKFISDIKDLETKFNDIAKTNSLAVSYDTSVNELPVRLDITLTDLNGPLSDTLYSTIKKSYGDQSTNGDLKVVIDRLRNAVVNKNQTNVLSFYDFSDIFENLVTKKTSLLASLSASVTIGATNSLSSIISNNFNIDTSIRGVINIFTTAIEVFLKQLLDVSSKYTDITRQKELKSIGSGNGKLDVLSIDQPIFPWPEFSSDGTERYIGDPDYGVQTPENVPEIQFVNDLFEGFKANTQVDNTLNNLNSSGVAFYSTNPADSIIMSSNKQLTNPYNRLPSNATDKDVALFVLLRAISFIGFSNTSLSQEEIENFVNNDMLNLTNKFTGTNILTSLKNNFPNAQAFSTISGLVGNDNQTILKLDNTNFIYDYLHDNKEVSLPVKFIETEISNVNQQNNPTITDNFYSNKNFSLTDFQTKDILLTNRVFGTNVNTNEMYIDIIERDEYENHKISGGLAAKDFDYKALSSNNYFPNSASLASAGFLANAGIYGVQEYTKINYGADFGVSSSLDYYTLFFGNYESNPTLCGPRTNTTPNENDISTLGYKIFIEGSQTAIDTINSNKNITAALNNNRGTIGNTKYYFSQLNDNKATVPYSYFSVYGDIGNNYFNEKLNINLSLFGSRFYNEQTLTGKTFLFLHSFPWNGLTGTENIGIFNQNEILNSFKNRTGFVQVPKLFPAFIGGLLLRAKEKNDIITWNDSSKNPLLPFTNTIKLPSKSQYLKCYNIV